MWIVLLFGCFFQAEDGIRDLVRSRGLGDVYKRQNLTLAPAEDKGDVFILAPNDGTARAIADAFAADTLSLIHI